MALSISISPESELRRFDLRLDLIEADHMLRAWGRIACSDGNTGLVERHIQGLTEKFEIATIADVTTWEQFEMQEPALAEQGRALLYFFGVGLGFLATVRADGGPRVHPMCPLIADGRMYGFIVRSPKQLDLVRDGRFAIHTFPMPDNEDAFYVAGAASRVTEQTTRQRLAEQFAAERVHLGAPMPDETQELFEFNLSNVLLTRTTGHGDPAPVHQVWRAA